MSDLDAMSFGKAITELPAAVGDTIEKELSTDKYGNQKAHVMHGGRNAIADEGSYFLGSNQTPGTGVAINAVVTAFSNTNGIVTIWNNESAGGKCIYLDFLRLLMSGTAPTATTVKHFAFAIDNIDRAPAANKTLITAKNANGRSGRASIATVYQYSSGGAFTVIAPSSNVRYSRCSLPTSLGITGDEYLIKFGAPDEIPTHAPLTAVRATAAARIVGWNAPVVIGPQQSLVIHRWWLTEATNAPTYELELGWYER